MKDEHNYLSSNIVTLVELQKALRDKLFLLPLQCTRETQSMLCHNHFGIFHFFFGGGGGGEIAKKRAEAAMCKLEVKKCSSNKRLKKNQDQKNCPSSNFTSPNKNGLI